MIKDLQGEGLAYLGLSAELAQLLKQRDQAERELRALMTRLEGFAGEWIHAFLREVEPPAEAPAPEQRRGRGWALWQR